MEVLHGLVALCFVVNTQIAEAAGQPSSSARDFVCEEGVPPMICMDNAQCQQCGWLSTLCKWLEAAEFSELGQQNQSLVELRAAKWVKGSTGALMKQTGPPGCVWVDAATHMLEIHNTTVDETLLCGRCLSV